MITGKVFVTRPLRDDEILPVRTHRIVVETANASNEQDSRKGTETEKPKKKHKKEKEREKKDKKEKKGKVLLFCYYFVFIS